MSYNRRTQAALVAILERYDRVVEVAIGRRTAVAAGLVDRGAAVTATDVHERAVPDGVTFVRDDITDPEMAVYEDADVIYALNCPPELHQSLITAAERADAECLFTTLGGDPPAIPVEPITLPFETLYRPA